MMDVLLLITVLLPTVVSGEQNFAHDLNHAIHKGSNHYKNIVVSPYNVELALKMLYDAMEPSHPTAKKIATKSLTHIGESKDLLPKITSGDIGLKSWVFLAVNKPNQVSKIYSDEMKDFFVDQETPVQDVDFSSKKYFDDINALVSKSTNGLLKGIFENKLYSKTKMLMSTAFYLSAKWGEDVMFTESHKNYQFRNLAYTVNFPKYVTMISGVMNVPYYEDNDMQIVKLPILYEDVSELMMCIVLPKRVNQPLREMNLPQVYEKMRDLLPHRTNYVNVTLPEFNIDFRSNLIDILKGMGISGLGRKGSSRGKSPFKRLLTKYDSNLFLSELQHKAPVKLNNMGLNVAETAAFPNNDDTPEETFKADHPFLFYITARYDGDDVEYDYEHFLFSGHYTGIDV